MVSTVFVDQSTVIESSWLNDVNAVVYDNYSGVIANVRAHGAVGDGVTDDTAAIQATIDLVEASATGGVVYLPPGAFKVTSNLTVTWPKLCVIRGAGSKVTSILDYRTSVSTGGCITYDASALAGSLDAYMYTWTGSFSLIKSINKTILTGLVITTLGTGTGLYLNGVVGGVYKDLVTRGYETNIYALDCLGFVIRDLLTFEANYGIYLAGASTLSGPNAVIIENVVASACAAWGLYIAGGMVQVLGGVYSDCGTMAVTSGGIYQGTAFLPRSLSVQGAFFEQNRGSADVYINKIVGATQATACSISNSVFVRTSSTYYVTNNIYFLNNDSTPVQLTVNNCGFDGYVSYAASAARKYVAVAGTFATAVDISYVSNTFGEATESPVTLEAAASFTKIGLTNTAGTKGNYIKLQDTVDSIELGGIVAVVPTYGFGPMTTNTYQLGDASYRWTTTYTQYLNVTGAFTWNSLVIPAPTTGTTTFLRNDGTWAAPGINYSYTGTLTGFTATLTGTVTYTRIGDVVTIDIPTITGTSNATTMTLTGGTDAMKPATTKTVICGVGESGEVVIGIINIETNGTLTFLRGLDGTAFTASGAKGIERLSFSYTVISDEPI